MTSENVENDAEIQRLVQAEADTCREAARVRERFVETHGIGPDGAIRWPNEILNEAGIRAIEEAEARCEEAGQALRTFLDSIGA